MTSQIKEKTEQEPVVSTSYLIRNALKNMADELKYKPIEARQYVPRVSVFSVPRERTPEEIKVEEIAAKYNL